MDKEEKIELPARRKGLMKQLFIGAAVGLLGAIGLKMGWQKLGSWAKGIKPEYTVGEASFYNAAMIGGGISSALSYETASNTEIDHLAEENINLQRKIELLKADKTFARQIEEEPTQSKATSQAR